MGEKGKKFHYAWVVCFACALMLFISMGLNSNTFTIYQPYLLEIRNFTNSQGSFIVTARSLTAFIGVITFPWVRTKLGLRRTAALGIMLQVSSRVIYALASTFPIYCAASVFAGLAYSWAGLVPISLFMGNWFKGHRGIALGLSATGSGVATVVAPPVVTALVEGHGLMTAFLVEALFTFLIGAIVILLVRDTPEQLNMEAFGEEEEEREEQVRSGAEVSLTRRQWYWVLFGVILLAGPAAPGFNHLTVLYTSEGYENATAAWFMTYLGLSLTVGKILVGEIADRLGSWRGNIFIGSCVTGGFAICCLAPVGGLALPLLAMTLLGLGLPVASVFFAIWAQDLRGKEGYGQAVTQCNLAYTIGSLVLSPIPGIIADVTGSYIPAYALFTLFTIACFGIVLFAYSRLGLHKKKARA